VELKWGLIPSWVKDASTGNKLITARGETVANKTLIPQSVETTTVFGPGQCLL
jgi:putative SOS response-associated peptidase YedK